MKYDLVPLGDACEFLDSQRVPVKDSDRKLGPYPYFGANGQQGWIDGYLFDEPLVLLAEDGGSFGSKTKPIAYKVEGKCWVNNHAHVLRPRENCDIDYLHRVLSYYDVSKYVNGTTRQKLTKGNAEDIPIPLPSSILEQRRLAALLDRADRLRRLRRYALEMSETYLQSVFLEMFGVPVTNPKHLPKAEFDEVCESRLGKMLDAKQQTGLHKRPYLRNENVQWGRFDLSDVYEMDFDEDDRKIFRLHNGDILICEGGEVGRAAIWRDKLPECYYQKALHRARPKPESAMPEFIVWLMWCLAKLGGLGDLTSQVTIAHLTGEKLKTLEFPLPLLTDQRRFADIAQKFERLRAQQREALRQAEMLFGALLKRAFEGEV